MPPLPARAAGVLLHPTSLPGAEGVGVLGAQARAFIDFLADAGVRVWQICPLGPTGYGDSPYQCLSARAGNPLLVDLEDLAARGWLPARSVPSWDASDRVDYGAVIPRKAALLAEARDRFRVSAVARDRDELAAWAAAESPWLDEYCLFAALKRRFSLAAWTSWPRPWRDRDPEALAAARKELEDDIGLERFIQWNFARQWMALRARARERGVMILGDMPIYAAQDSVEAWASRNLFQVRPDGSPGAVAGVPPDYFSPDGQLWGNPLWDWKALAADGFAPWTEIVAAQLERYDALRIDHFRGFSEYWAVPPDATTARSGTWRRGPGIAPFIALAEAVESRGAAEGRTGSASRRPGSSLPIVAENLGALGWRARLLLRRSGFPGMKVLQFAFDSAEGGRHDPDRGAPDCVLYTGTHDNDTTAGWFASASERDRARALSWLGVSAREAADADFPRELPWRFIRAALESPCRIAVVPVQDLLSLGSGARMNRPGTAGGNWTWRLLHGQLDGGIARRLRSLAEASGRI